MQITGLQYLVEEQQIQEQEMQDYQIKKYKFTIKDNIPYSNLLARKVNQINCALYKLNIVFYIDIDKQLLLCKTNQASIQQFYTKKYNYLSIQDIQIEQFKQFIQAIFDKYLSYLFNTNSQQLSRRINYQQQQSFKDLFIKNYNYIICNEVKQIEKKQNLPENSILNQRLYQITFAFPDYKSDQYQEEVFKYDSLQIDSKFIKWISQINQYCQYVIQIYYDKSNIYMQYYPNNISLRKYNEYNPNRAIEWNLIIMYRLSQATKTLYEVNNEYPKFNEDCVLVYQYPSFNSYHQIKLFKWSECDDLQPLKDLYQNQTKLQLISNTIDDILQEILDQMQKYEILDQI